MKRLERGSAPWLYWEAHYFNDGETEPFAINDFLNGDLLRWIGTPITEKITRINPDTKEPEFLSANTGEWVTKAQKYRTIVVNGKETIERVHYPARRMVGTYTEDNVKAKVLAQSQAWIATHPERRGDRRDRALGARKAVIEVPAAVREVASDNGN